MKDTLRGTLPGLLFSLALACVGAEAIAAASPRDYSAGAAAEAPRQKRAVKRKPAPLKRAGKPSPKPKAAVAAARGFVRLDALAIPAGYMTGRGNPATFVSQNGAPEKCQEHAGCVQFTLTEGGGWGGVMWWPPECGPDGKQTAWDNARYGRCGVDVPESGGLRSVDKLTFFAKGERGGEVVEFKVGAGDIRPSPARSRGRLPLTTQWTKYEIDLHGVNLSGAASLFTWVAADDANPHGAIFYLADVQFEGVK